MDVVKAVILNFRDKFFTVYRDASRETFKNKKDLFKKDIFEVKIFCGENRNLNANRYIAVY